MSKDKSKSQDSQHKSDYEYWVCVRERERERERTKIPWCCLRSGATSPPHFEGWGSYFLISLLPSPISQSPIWAKLISDLAIVELFWVFNVAVAALLSLFFFFFENCCLAESLLLLRSDLSEDVRFLLGYKLF